MKLRDWDKLLRSLPPETPVVFYRAGDRPLEAGDYCDGRSVAPSAGWEGRDGAPVFWWSWGRHFNLFCLSKVAKCNRR